MRRFPPDDAMMMMTVCLFPLFVSFLPFGMRVCTFTRRASTHSKYQLSMTPRSEYVVTPITEEKELDEGEGDGERGLPVCKCLLPYHTAAHEQLLATSRVQPAEPGSLAPVQWNRQRHLNACFGITTASFNYLRNRSTAEIHMITPTIAKRER